MNRRREEMITWLQFTTEPSQIMDEMIATECGLRTDNINVGAPLPYTASIDAALTLIPQTYAVRMHQYIGHENAWASISANPGTVKPAFLKSLLTARLLACAISALAVQLLMPDDDG